MFFVSCSIPEQFVNPLFEVFDGGDFILSSYHDVEEELTQMRIFFEDASRKDGARHGLRQAMDVVGVEAPIEDGEIPDEDWKLAYRRHFKAEPIGSRLLIVPEWELSAVERSEQSKGRTIVHLDPGMAFGTGKHETTRACLEYIDELSGLLGCSASRLSFLDMGCGSGILSIAAARLGFGPVVGFDIDEEAVKASRENAALNGVAVDYRVFALGKGAVSFDESIEAAKGIYPDLSLQEKAKASPDERFQSADLVVANILGPLLIAFADEISSYAKETLIVSGILNELYPDVLKAFSAHGFREVSRKTLGEWTTGLLTCR